MKLRFGSLAMLAASDAKSTDAQEIARIEQEWCEAIESRNREFFARYLDEDFTYVNEDGLFQGSAAFVEPMMESPTRIKVSISDQRVTLHGATGVVTGRFTVRDGTTVFTSLYTNVFAKGPEGWKAVALHETRSK